MLNLSVEVATFDGIDLKHTFCKAREQCFIHYQEYY